MGQVIFDSVRRCIPQVRKSTSFIQDRGHALLVDAPVAAGNDQYRAVVALAPEDHALGDLRDTDAQRCYRQALDLDALALFQVLDLDDLALRAPSSIQAAHAHHGSVAMHDL